jgi:hypothetical protein
MNHMETTVSEAEILALFQTLGIVSDEERRRLLLSLGYCEPVRPLENVRFDIGFNAALPSK